MNSNPILSHKFAALGDPIRLAILALLAQGEMTVLEIVKPFDISQPAVSRHLKVLEEAGLIERRVDGSRRPCRLSAKAVDEIDAWLQMMRRALEANYDRLDQVLEKMKKEQENA